MLRANDFIQLYENVYKIPYKGEVLYNVLMEEHEKLVVNNLICETLHPNNKIAKLYKKYNTKSDTKIINKTIYIRFNKINNYKFENIHTFDEFNYSPKVLRNDRICDLLSPNYLDYI